MCRVMGTPIESLERRIETLRAGVREAVMAGDRHRAASLRRDLRAAERAWEQALGQLSPARPGGGNPLAAPGGRAGQPAFDLAGAPATSQPGVPGAAQADGRRGGPPDRDSGAPGPPGGAEPGGAEPGWAEPGRAERGGAERGGLSIPLREQVYQALTMLTVPAAPKLISSVHEAFFAGAIFGARLTSLRRDEERSFRTAPFARPYYLCAALTADLLAPARGLLAVSTWPMERRVIGPLSPRVDFLTAAIAVADAIARIPDPGPAALRLLWRFAVNIPGGTSTPGKASPPAVARAAAAEREIHADADQATRRSAAARARGQLDDAQQLFGTRLRVTPRTGTAP